MNHLRVITLMIVSSALTGLHAQSAVDLAPLVSANVFEVVVKRPVVDPMTYAEPLPLDLMSFEERAGKEYLSLGTAFAIPGGRFVTAAHVLGLERPSLQTEFGLRTSEGLFFPMGKILAFSSWRDYAVFEVPGLKAPGLAPSPAPTINTRVYTAGNALGSGLALREGLYTSKTAEAWKGAWTYLRFSAPASPGNSGGPLLDEQGQILGIVTRKSENENLNYALPWTEVDVSPVARLDEQYLYGFPLAPDRITVENHKEWPLPLGAEQLRSLLVSVAREGQRSASARLRSELVPGSEVLGDNRFVTMPGFLKKKENGAWEIAVPSEPKTFKAGPDGVLSVAEQYGDTLMSLAVPPGTAAGLASQPKALMDLILQGNVLSRKVAGKSIRILSFGEPAALRSFEDAHGRVWTLARFDIPELDFSELLLWLPTPSGGVGMLRGLSHSSALGFEIDFEAMADFAFVTYVGTLTAWGAFLDQTEQLPRTLRPWTLYWKPGKSLSLDMPRFRWSFGTSSANILDGGVLAAMPGYYNGKNGPVWQVGTVVYSAAGDYRDYLALNRQPAPLASGGSADQDGWKKLLNREGSYTGVPFDTKERTLVRAVLSPLNDAAVAVEEIFWAGLYADGIKDHSLVRSRFRAMAETSMEKTLSPGDPAPVPKIGGASLFDALREGDDDLARKFLKNKRALEARSDTGLTVLQAALTLGRLAVATELIAGGASQVAAPGTLQPVELAAQAGSKDLVRLLLGSSAPRTIGLMLTAIDQGWDDVVTLLASDPVLRDAAGPGGATPLMRALDRKNEDLAQRLLTLGASTRAADASKWTVLDHALRAGLVGLSRQILALGKTDLTSRTTQGWSALHFAAVWLPELVPDVIAAGDKALIDARTADGTTALMLAVWKGGDGLALRDAGAKIDLANTRGWTALALALRYGDLMTMMEFLSNPIDSMTNAEGWNLLHLAARYCPERTARVVQGWTEPQKLAAANARGPGGMTPLHLAVISRNRRAVQSLLDMGADPSIIDDRGRTASDQAGAQGDGAWMEALLR